MFNHKSKPNELAMITIWKGFDLVEYSCFFVVVFCQPCVESCKQLQYDFVPNCGIRWNHRDKQINRESYRYLCNEASN